MSISQAAQYRTSNVAENFDGYIFVRNVHCTTQGNNFELISTRKMETRHPVEGSFGSEFPAIFNHWVVMAAWSRKSLKFGKKYFAFFFEKSDPLH